MIRTVVATVVAAGVLIPLTRADVGNPVEPFNGKDLTGWKVKGEEKKSQWKVLPGSPVVDPNKPIEFRATGAAAEGLPTLVNLKPGSQDLYTMQTFADGVFEAEFMIPKGSNSGIYLMGEYEVQILDSYGKEKVGPGDLGGIYSTAAPKVNASKKPGEWQKIVIAFQAPRFVDGKKTANAKFIKVTLNDQVIHEDVEMKGPTPGGLTGKEAATGPLMFQGDHGAVAFRNVRVTPQK